jgi:hypothetical protein
MPAQSRYCIRPASPIEAREDGSQVASPHAMSSPLE